MKRFGVGISHCRAVGRAAGRLLLFGFMLMAAGCAGLRGGAPTPGPAMIEVQRLEVQDSEDRTEILIHADRPLIYTAYKLKEPLRLVVDLSGATLEKVPKSIEVNNAMVRAVMVQEGMPPNYVARIEIGIAEAADHRIEPGDNSLSISVSRPRLAAAEPDVPQVDAIPEDEVLGEEFPEEDVEEELPILPPAENITDVRVDAQEFGLIVSVLGDGALSPLIFTLEDFRMVADFMGATHRIRPNVIRVDHPLLKRIRLGQHKDPKKARLVLDLTGKVDYTLEEEGNRIEIRVRPVQAADLIEQPPARTPPPPRVEPAPKTPPPVARAAPPPRPEPRPERVAPAPAAPAPPTAELLITPTEAEALPKKYTGRRISLDFQDADVTNVLRLIADVSGFNMVLGDDVKGKITLKLHDVPWDQALDIILRSKGLGRIKEGNIIRIDTNSSIARQQEEEAKAKESLIKAEDLVTQIIRVNYSKATELAGTLKKSLSPRGDVTVDDSTNTLIVKDIPKNLADVIELVKILDRQTPQILIEARIVQADTSFARDLGIQWGGDFSTVRGSTFIGAQGTTPDTPFGTTDPAFAVNLPASGTAGPLGQVGLVLGKFTGSPINLDLRLSAGETKGDTKLLSNPKIATLDNQEASIQQGESIPFETVSQNGTQTQFIDAVINLTVTPHATPNGSVVMDVKVAKNSLGTFRSASGTPSIDKKEVSTQILVGNGETVVLGGIFESTKISNVAGIPWFKKIPFLGWLFKRESKVDTHRELLIFITPSIIEEQFGTSTTS